MLLILLTHLIKPGHEEGEWKVKATLIR